jgi:hypothetical protein
MEASLSEIAWTGFLAGGWKQHNGKWRSAYQDEIGARLREPRCGLSMRGMRPGGWIAVPIQIWPLCEALLSTRSAGQLEW